jgi:F0F1-type ATP synthase membrane subunit b/b'
MRLIFWWSIFACIFMSVAWIFAYKKYKGGIKEEQDLIEEEMNQNMGDLMRLEIMRRMAQSAI